MVIQTVEGPNSGQQAATADSAIKPGPRYVILISCCPGDELITAQDYSPSLNSRERKHQQIQKVWTGYLISSTANDSRHTRRDQRTHF